MATRFESVARIVDPTFLIGWSSNTKNTKKISLTGCGRFYTTTTCVYHEPDSVRVLRLLYRNVLPPVLIRMWSLISKHVTGFQTTSLGGNVRIVLPIPLLLVKKYILELITQYLKF